MSGPVRTAALAAALCLLSAACATSLDIELDPAAVSDPTDAGPVSDPPTDVDDIVGNRAVWAEGSCPFAEPTGVTTTCGTLEVPARWDDTGAANELSLAVGIFSRGGGGTPLVYLEGGPGGDPLSNIGQAFGLLFDPFADERDVVVLAQRGTGPSEPNLDCASVDALEIDLLDDALAEDEELDRFVAAYESCATELRTAGADLGAFNSVQNAHDVEALRRALGHDQWHVVGISYGTRLAQTLMRLHPGGIRSVILDSVYTLERQGLANIPQVAQRSFELLFSECAASDICSFAYPDLRERYFALVDALDENPISFTVADALTGEQYPAALNGLGLLNTTFGALYSKAGISALPELVVQLEAGETSGIAAFVGQEVTNLPFLADGMYWSVECNEEVPFIGGADLEGGLTGDPVYDRLSPAGTGAFFESVCGAFDSGVAPPEENVAITSDIPSLLMAGSYDPITPPADTASLQAGLANSTYVELPHTGHAALSDPCGQDIAVEFLADPEGEPDLACVDSIEEPRWVVDLFAALTFEPFEYESAFASGSGVVPVGWDELGDGTFIQADNNLHVSVIVQQAVVGLPAEQLLGFMGNFLGADLTEEEVVVYGGKRWIHGVGDVPGSVLDVYASDLDGTTLLVLLQHAPGDRDRAVEILVPELLTAFEP